MAAVNWEVSEPEPVLERADPAACPPRFFVLGRELGFQHVTQGESREPDRVLCPFY